MNTIKFSKADNLTTEQHNLELVNINKEKIFGKELNIYHPCNLNIFVTEACHSKCFYCINNKTNTQICMGKSYISKDDYLSAFEKLLNELGGKGFEATITGGEPTLDAERFIKTMELCKKYKVPCRTVSTTGLNLIKTYKEKPLCVYMIENGFTHNINISRMHYDESKNSEIFGTDNNISNKEIEKLATFFKLNGAEMRISCNLIQNYIDDFDKMMQFVNFYMDLNVETVMFRELIHPENIKLQDVISPELLERQGFNCLETLHGLVYDVDVYKKTSACGNIIAKHYKTLEQIDNDIIYSFSFKDGKLMNGFSGDKMKINLIDEKHFS